MAKSFKGLAKGPAPKLTEFEKDMYEPHEKKELHEEKETPEGNAIFEANDINELTPFSTRITRGLYRKVRQFEYWERMRITEIVEQALEQYLTGRETAEKPLPERELKRLQEISRNKKRKG